MEAKKCKTIKTEFGKKLGGVSRVPCPDLVAVLAAALGGFIQLLLPRGCWQFVPLPPQLRPVAPCPAPAGLCPSSLQHKLLPYLMLKNPSPFSPLLSQARARAGGEDVTAPAHAVWRRTRDQRCLQGPAEPNNNGVCSLGSPGCSHGSVGLQEMFYRTRQSLWDFLNFTQTFFFPFLPHFPPPISFLLNKISSRSRQKQAFLLKLNLATALK